MLHHLRSKARQSVHRLGLDIRPYAESRAVKACRASLINRGVDVVLDVGANTGQFARESRDWGFSGQIMSFEPTSEAFLRLKTNARSDPLWDVYHFGLGSEPDERTIQVAGNSQSSSFLQMTPEHEEAAPGSAVCGSEEVWVDTLDRVAETLISGTSCLYLKVDVQGLELEVLRGATSILPRTSAIELELSLYPLYVGSPLVDEVVGELREYGYALISVEPAWAAAQTGTISQLNGVFKRLRI